MKRWQMKNSDMKRYIAEFSELDVDYQIIGIMDKKEFNEILENLFFK